MHYLAKANWGFWALLVITAAVAITADVTDGLCEEVHMAYGCGFLVLMLAVAVMLGVFIYRYIKDKLKPNKMLFVYFNLIGWSTLVLSGMLMGLAFGKAGCPGTSEITLSNVALSQMYTGSMVASIVMVILFAMLMGTTANATLNPPEIKEKVNGEWPEQETKTKSEALTPVSNDDVVVAAAKVIASRTSQPEVTKSDTAKSNITPKLSPKPFRKPLHRNGTPIKYPIMAEKARERMIERQNAEKKEIIEEF